MRTKKVIIVAIISFLSISIYAQNKMEGTVKIEYERTKEYQTHDKKNRITWKTEYKYDDLGSRIRQISYKRDKSSEWTPIQKHEYQYDSNGKIANIIYSKWNTKTKTWNNKSEMLIYLYNNTERYMVVKKNTAKE